MNRGSREAKDPVHAAINRDLEASAWFWNASPRSVLSGTVNGRRLPRSLCIFAGAALYGACVPVTASASFDASASAQEPSSDRERAKRLYQEGKVAFDLANFDEAIEKFEQAYALMSAASDADTYKVLSLIVRNLSLAHRKAFELTEQEINLQKALILLKRYESQLGDIEATETFPQEDIDAQIRDAAEAIAELEAQIAGLEAGRQEPEEPPPSPAEEDGAGAAEVDPAASAVEAAPGKPAKPMFIAGGAMLGLGAAGAAVGITGALMGRTATDGVFDAAPEEERQNLINKGTTGNALAFVGIGVGSVGLITGVALIAVGVKRKRAGGAAKDLSVAPIFGREQAGVQVEWRF